MATKFDTKRIYLDDLDEELLETINQEGTIALCDLARQSDERYNVLLYRVHSLAEHGLISAKRARKRLILSRT
jgi:predicted transcriptional regulator